MIDCEEKGMKGVEGLEIGDVWGIGDGSLDKVGY